MKLLVIVASILLASPSAFSKVLMTCKISDGDTVEATVIRTKSGLFLKEVMTNGDQKVRPLNEKNWKIKKFHLRAEIYPNAKALLYKKNSQWFLSYRSLGYSNRSQVNCQ